MSRTDTHSLIDRVYLTHRALKAAHRPLSASELEGELGNCSRRQLQKTITHLRDVLRAPLAYDAHQKGWYYEPSVAFELPGLWFTAEELHALLAAEQMLAQAQPGALSQAVQQLRQRIVKVLQRGSREPSLRLDAFSITTPMLRRADRSVFAQVAEATLQAKVLSFHYESRSRAEGRQRSISPRRIELNRGNWYVLGWCHQQQDWRRFALDRVAAPEILSTPLQGPAEAPEARGFGLFDRMATQTAVLVFSAHRARWIRDEIWHRDQVGTELPDGRYRLSIPYGEPTELILDILRYGPDVEVEAPASLRQAVIQRLQQALSQYQAPD